jgi:hypothetical protein
MKTEESLRKHIEGLENMISHKIGQPTMQIIGISNLLEKSKYYSLDGLKQLVGYLKPSALDLDNIIT